MLAFEALGLGREWGDAGELVRDGGVERGFCGEGGSVVGSLRLRMPRLRKGDMVVVVVVVRGHAWMGRWEEGWKGRSDVFFPLRVVVKR